MLEKLKPTFKSATVVLAVVGSAGFFADYLYQPITWVGLILLGVAVSPWLLQVVKRVKVGGFEMETRQASVQEIKAKADEDLIEQAGSGTGELPTDIGVRPRSRMEYLADERRIIEHLADRTALPVRPEMKFGPFVVDAVIDGPHLKTIVEVKLIYGTKTNPRIAFASGAKTLGHIRSLLRSEGTAVRGLLAVGYEGGPDRKAHLENLANEISRQSKYLEVELFDLEELRNA